MKKKYALIAIFAAFVATSADASRDGDFDHTVAYEACELTKYQSAVLQQRWNELAMQQFMVSLEAPPGSEMEQRTRAQVNRGLAKLRREFGADCVLDIL